MVTRFGAYEILFELKSGGMGAVLLGRRRGPGTFEQLVAIKTIRPEYAGAEAVRAMFLDEAAILARVNHPGIATVHDFGEEGGTLYMVMEYVAGIPFRELPPHRPTPTVVARAMVDACRGLHAAHEARDLSGALLGVVHRDISPDNLMLGFDGHVKVIDFGIALIKNRQSPVTEFGTLKGKPPYMSPEQIKNDAIDRRSDVFSLGVVLHELLTGAPLFEGDSIYAVARAVEHKEIKPPSLLLGTTLPLGLDAVVMNALDRDVERRTQTAAALAEELDQVLNNAGDESLEMWAERELAVARDAHRAWLATVISGRDVVRPKGRQSGEVTELAPIGEIKTIGTPVAGAAIPQADPPIDTSASTHLDANRDDDDELLPPRKSLALPILLAFVVLGAVGGGIYMSQTRRASAPVDAAIAAITPIDATIAPVDAAPSPRVDASELDAAVLEPIDAGRRHERTVPRDAAPAVVIDARPIARGTGTIDITHKPGGSFVNVTIDGVGVGSTPIFARRLAAGPHTIKLLAADTGEVVYEQTITIEDGKAAHVVPP